MFRTVPLSHHQKFFIVHTAMVYVIQVCWQQTCVTYTVAVCTVWNFWWWTEEMSETCRRNSVLILLASCQHIYYCCVYSEKFLMMDRGTVQTCRVLFQNKFEKLVHPVGFIIRIYHARSPERQTLCDVRTTTKSPNYYFWERIRVV